MESPETRSASADGWRSNVDPRSPLCAGIAFLVLSATLFLILSSSLLLTGDEFLSLWTDRLPTLAQIAHVQRTCPISIDPLLYHVAAHTAIGIFGVGPFALRLPSVIGYLLMQVCLFFFVRRIAGGNAAFFALAFPAVTSTLLYSVDARPYGLLLGFLTLAMVCWQTATRRQLRRTPWLVTLAASIAVTINLHYFGVLLLIPLCVAESYRAWRRKAVDVPVLCAIAAGAAGILGVLPFLKAASEFRSHYCCYQLKLDAISEVYLSMFPHMRGTRLEPAMDALLLVAALLILWSCFRQVRLGSVMFREAEGVLLITFALLPFAGYILARLTTHVLEPRYVIGAFPSIAALVAIGIAPAFGRRGVRRAVYAAMYLGVLLAGMRYIQLARRSRADNVESVKITPEIRAALSASMTGKLYFQDAEAFAFASYYEPDADIRSRMVLVYSRSQELKWNHTDTGTFQALCMRNFTTFEIEPYESLTGRSSADGRASGTDQSGDFVFALVDDPRWDWVANAFKDANAKVRPVGSAFGTDIVSVRFPSQNTRTR
jgi:hypothetical protein